MVACIHAFTTGLHSTVSNKHSFLLNRHTSFIQCSLQIIHSYHSWSLSTSHLSHQTYLSFTKCLSVSLSIFPNLCSTSCRAQPPNSLISSIPHFSFDPYMLLHTHTPQTRDLYHIQFYSLFFTFFVHNLVVIQKCKKYK